MTTPTRAVRVEKVYRPGWPVLWRYDCGVCGRHGRAYTERIHAVSVGAEHAQRQHQEQP